MLLLPGVTLARACISYKIDYLLGRGVVASVRKRINPAMPTLLAPAFLITPTELSKVLFGRWQEICPPAEEASKYETHSNLTNLICLSADKK